ncbi:Gfo/Idh/MocA family oxidoreductase [Amylibacter sp.]|nr:Gfo/Idh/MocA family oxidoreductase [Amylibacter sp.]
MSKLKVGIAGYGIVGKRRRGCVEGNPNLELVAVCDKSFGSDGTFSDGIKYYTNYKDLLNQPLDIVIVCMTNDIAPLVTIAALNRDLHVFCEKPPGRNVEDINDVIEHEKQHPRCKLMYGFNHRYHESVQDAQAIIESGGLGKIINMRGVYGKSKIITFNQPDWRTKREIAGGGVLLDQGIHMLDLMRLFAGEFKDVHSFISNGHWGYDVEDNAYAIMRTKEGVVGMLNSSATQWRHRFNLDINLERGSLILGGILSGTKSYGAETLTVVTVNHQNDTGDPREQVTRYNSDPSWEEELNIFAQCILNNIEVTSGSSLDALNTMKLVYEIYHADPLWRDTYDIKDPNA